MLCLKPELRSFLTTSKLLTLEVPIASKLLVFLSSAFPPSSYLGKNCQIYHDFFSLKYKQKHTHLWSLAKELACFVGIVIAVGVRQWDCLFECLLI